MQILCLHVWGEIASSCLFELSGTCSFSAGISQMSAVRKCFVICSSGLTKGEFTGKKKKSCKGDAIMQAWVIDTLSWQWIMLMTLWCCLWLKTDVKEEESDPKDRKQKHKITSQHANTRKKRKAIPVTQQKHNPCKRLRSWMEYELKVIIMDEYLLCNALNRDISPPSSLPTALICLLMAWQISLPAAICAFSPSKPPRVARSMKETQRREYTASTCVCVARGWDTRSRTWDRNVAKLRSSHWPPSVVTNTT